MSILSGHHRPFGKTGLALPPIVFGSAALGNVERVITEQAKLAICGEWFQHVAPPVWIEVDYGHGDGMALEVLGRVLRRLEIPSRDVVIQLAMDLGRADSDPRSSAALIVEYWQKSCRLLGEEYLPDLVSIRNANGEGARSVHSLKAFGAVRGCGVVVRDCENGREWVAAINPDWVSLAGGCSIMRHPAEMRASVAEMAEREAPIVASDVFDSGFLLGGNQLDGRTVNSDDSANRSLLAWRKAFVALCDGHGISPAHACIQFALAIPGVFAVRLESSYADRVREDVRYVCENAPENFWASMREEGLLVAGR
jgi:D-threo-aldose 1-dehydrogenase